MAPDTILIIENDAAMLTTLRDRLEQAGYAVIGILFPRDLGLFEEVMRNRRFILCIMDLWLSDSRDAMGLAPERAYEFLAHLEKRGVLTLIFTNHPNYIQPAKTWLKNYSAYVFAKAETLNLQDFLDDGLSKLIFERIREAKWLEAAEGFGDGQEWHSDWAPP